MELLAADTIARSTTLGSMSTRTDLACRLQNCHCDVCTSIRCIQHKNHTCSWCLSAVHQAAGKRYQKAVICRWPDQPLFHGLTCQKEHAQSTNAAQCRWQAKGARHHLALQHLRPALAKLESDHRHRGEVLSRHDCKRQRHILEKCSANDQFSIPIARI